MCGRYWVEVEDDAEEMRKIVEALNRRGEKVKLGEICPTDAAATVLADGPRAMRWGFPSPAGAGVIINARSETVSEKPMFRASRRLAVPVSGFFEWKRLGPARVKYLFRAPGEGITYLAGLYGVFDAGGAVEERFVILTTAANEAVSPYHDRMPLYLGEGDVHAWLTAGEAAPAQPHWEAVQADDEEQLSFL